ncbi:MAG: cell division protein FtsA [Salinisphaera sp.]|nr:cell division protein FtsA [Salinisphaera sp.]
MTKRLEKNLVVGLDIGTSKVACIVAEQNAQGELEIIGMGSQASKGMKKGIVVNIEAMTQSIRRAVEEAELMAGCRIGSVYCGISGAHVRSINSHGIVAVRSKEVTESDIERVIDAACAVAIPADQKILHVLPQEFAVDDNEGIQEPVGMSGVRLEARVHIVTGAVSSAHNIQKCVARCGLDVAKLSLEQLASAKAVLNDDEKDLGVCLVDIGGGTSDIAVFANGAIRHSAVIPIAGDQVTNDIAVALRTPTVHAEEIKIRYGCALPDLIEDDDAIEVPSVGERPPRRLSRYTLAEVIKPRYEELFMLIHKELVRSGYDEVIASGVVLTGGSSKMEGVIDLAEEVFHMPVRLGVPQHIGGLTDVVKNPLHATGVGLLQFGNRSTPGYVPRGAGATGSFEQAWNRMKSWFQGNF